MKRAASALVLVLAASPAAAALLRAQGTLTDGAGRPVHGTVRLDFRIIDTVTRAEAWSEAREVEVTRGAFAVTLGAHESLPAPATVKPGWRLAAAAPLGSGWSAGVLSAAGEDDRRVHLSRLLARLGAEPEASVATLPPEYKQLFAAPPAVHTPPETVSVSPDCAEDALAWNCPKAMMKVLDREERLLRERLRRLPLEQRPLLPPVPIGLAAR